MTPQQVGDSLLDSQYMVEGGFIDAVREVYSTGRPFVASEWSTPIPQADGSVREFFFDFTYAPWFWPDGSIRGMVGHALDVTDSVRRRKVAEQSAERWRERFTGTRDAIVALQSALLPASVPVVPGLQLAARYLVAGSETTAGGDWYSAVPLPDGRVGLVVGDVVGHGVAACATMGQLRAVLEEHLSSGDGLVEALSSLNAYVTSLPAADGATVCVAIVDPHSGAVEYCTAGHPPPLLVDGAGWRYLEPTGSRPLGRGTTFAKRTGTLPTDALLMLYSDGLVERPGVDREASTREVGRVVARLHRQRQGGPGQLAEIVCENALHLLTRRFGYDDDLTVLAARRTDPPPGLALDVPATAKAITDLADGLGQWLRTLEAGERDLRDLQHVIVEVATNSVEHAPTNGEIPQLRLTAELGADGVATLEVSDSGTWKDADTVRQPSDDATPRVRGLGLALAGQLVDSLVVKRDDAGTQVTVTRRLRRSTITRGETAAAEAVPSVTADLVVSGVPGTPGLIRVQGPVLQRTAGSLRDFLDIHDRGHTRDLTVDLSGVSHLASVGVRVLVRAARRAEENGTTLTFLAPPGSVAEAVLHLSGLPVSWPTKVDGAT